MTVAVRAERPARAVSVSRRIAEPAAVFVFAYVVYALAGLALTLGLHVVLVDAQSRLEHAYVVWWNDPSKLAAIGFYWPPVQTLVLLPAALVRPLAQSLAALPLTSAAFGAGLVVVIDRSLRTIGVERALRWLLVAAFALNPMIFFYATNGMSEIVYLFFLTMGVAAFVRWSIEPKWFDFPVIGIAFGIGVLSRYELGLWLPVLLAGAIAVLVQRRVAIQRIEASVVAATAPAIYALVLWSFLNWTITGHPLGFLTENLGGTTVLDPVHASAARIVWDVVWIHARIFPPMFAVAALSLTVGIRRRKPVGIALAVALLVNVFSTIALVLHARDAFLFELRYNMRSMPIAMIAIGWLLVELAPRWRRIGAVAAVAAVVAAAPATAWTMAHHPKVVGERAFIRAITTGADEDGIDVPHGTGVSVRAQRAMASYVRAHVHGRESVLVDEAQVFGIELADGDPTRYLSRTDHGDKRWFALRARPVGRVRYLLVNLDPYRPDLIVQRYPALRGRAPLPSFIRRVHVDRPYALYAVR